MHHYMQWVNSLYNGFHATVCSLSFWPIKNPSRGFTSTIVSISHDLKYKSALNYHWSYICIRHWVTTAHCTTLNYDMYYRVKSALLSTWYPDVFFWPNKRINDGPESLACNGWWVCRLLSFSTRQTMYE